jgi:hypothetical protein
LSTIQTATSVSKSQFAEHLRATIEAAPLYDLDIIAKKLWAAHGAGALTDGEAQQLAEQMIQHRRRARAQVGAAIGTLVPRHRIGRIHRSPEQRSPDRRASIHRRRTHAATGPLPPALAAHFTTGELAVLKVVSDEWLAHGACDLSLNEIAARAGVCRKLAKQAVRLAKTEHSLITVQRRPRSGRKHLTNIIRIVRVEWVDWLNKGRRKAYAVGACNKAKLDFPKVRGVQNDPPRSQVLKTLDDDPVDKSARKWNRPGASRAGP